MIELIIGFFIGVVVALAGIYYYYTSNYYLE
jgi:hypothetical protein